MKCKACNTEMFIDSVTDDGDREIYHYKCPNPKCTNYGYKGSSAKEGEK